MTTKRLLQMAARIPKGIERKEAPATKFIEAQILEIKSEILAKIGEGDTRLTGLQRQVDSLDMSLQTRHVGGAPSKSLADILKESDSLSRLVQDRKGRAIITLSGADAMGVLERKTAITSVAAGAQTAGVLQIERIPGITPEARQALTIRDVLTARPTAFGYIDFVKVLAPMTPASPQVESEAKMENAVTFTTGSEKIKTIATWVPASRQILDDLSELAAFLETSLRFYVNLAEEIQFLSGDGTGQNQHGLITQAAAFNTALLTASAGWSKIDIVGRAFEQQVIAREFNPTFVVLNPRDWMDCRLLKNSLGEYILGDPQTDVPPALFNRRVVETNSIAAGTFLVGSGDPAAAEIRDRMELQFEVSTEHADYFTRNLVACRAEKRTALIVKRPNAFLTGTFTTSP